MDRIGEIGGPQGWSGAGYIKSISNMTIFDIGDCRPAMNQRIFGRCFGKLQLHVSENVTGLKHGFECFSNPLPLRLTGQNVWRLCKVSAAEY